MTSITRAFPFATSRSANRPGRLDAAPNVFGDHSLGAFTLSVSRLPEGGAALAVVATADRQRVVFASPPAAPSSPPRWAGTAPPGAPAISDPPRRSRGATAVSG